MKLARALSLALTLEVNINFILLQEPLVFSSTTIEGNLDIEVPRPKRRQGRPLVYKTL